MGLAVASVSSYSAAAEQGGAPAFPGHFASGEVRIVSSSHQDTAWMDTPDFCRRFRIEKNILPALERMRVDPDYTFCMEGTLHLMEFLEEHPELYNDILRFTKEGRFEWGATYNQPYESWLSGEELVRQLYFGRRWVRKTLPGCDAKVAFNPDPPARALQMQQILAKAGVPYLFISRYHEGLYRWGSPDGSSVLAYSPGQYTNHVPFLAGDPAKCITEIQAKLAQQSPYYAPRAIPPVYALINSADFSKPIDFRPLIERWNAQPAAGSKQPPVMRYSSIRGFFEAIDQPQVKFDRVVGERPDVWAYITDPTHHRTATVRREGARLLPAAEIFTTIACLLQDGFRDWPGSQFNAAWLNQLYIDHGIGGKNGHITDEVFHLKVEKARAVGRTLLDRALNAIAAQVRTETGRGEPLVVFNDLSWPRTDVVQVELADGADRPARVIDPDGNELPAQLVERPGADEVNVAAAALGAKATASSTLGHDYEPAKAIDGQWAVRDPDPELGPPDEWKSAAGAGPHWLQIDFGQPRPIHKVVVRHEGVLGVFGAETRHNTCDFAIQAADSAEGPWTDLVAPVRGNTLALTSHAFAARTVRFLRVFITKGTQPQGDGGARILEVQALSRVPSKARTLLFVARDVPGLGYRTYYLDRRAGRPAATQRAAVAATTGGCENQFYRVTLAPGGMKSIVDKAQRRELLASDKFLGGEVFTMLSVAPDNRRYGTDAGEFGSMPLPVMDDSFDRVATHKPQWSLREDGPVRTVFELEQPLADTTVRQRVVVWRQLKRIDCEVDLVDFNGRYWREFRMALPLASSAPQISYEVPMGVVEIGKDEIPGTGGFAKQRRNGPDLVYADQCRDIHPRQARNFIDASDAQGGLTMSSSVAVFDWIDPTEKRPAAQPVLQPVLLASRKSCNGQGVWYPQTGDHSFRFALTSHEGGWRNGWRDGIGANHPLLAVVARPGQRPTLPASMSFARTSADNVIITTIKKAEDDDSVVARVYDIEGRTTESALEFFTPVAGAARTNVIEDGGEPLPVESGRVRLTVGHHAIETVKLTLRPR